MVGWLGPDAVDGIVQLLTKNLAIQEQQRAESLVLRRRGNMAFNGQMG